MNQSHVETIHVHVAAAMRENMCGVSTSQFVTVLHLIGREKGA